MAVGLYPVAITSGGTVVAISGMVQTVWMWEPAIYLFLGGLAGGTFFATALVRFLSNNACPKVTAVGAWVSTAALVVGLLFLVSDVAKPFQAMRMWDSFVNPGSWMVIGAWLLLAAVVFMGLCAVFSTPWLVRAIESFCKPLARHAEAISRACMAVGALLGLGVAMYTGVLLWNAHSIPLWNTPLIAVLFTISALDAGAGVVLATLMFEKSGYAVVFVRRTSVALLVLIVLEACALATLLLTHLAGSQAQALSASLLVSGELNIQFWVLVVMVGLAAPFLFTAIVLSRLVRTPELCRLLHFGAVACSLIGGFALRYVILAGGMHDVPASLDAYQAMLSVYTCMG